MKLISFSATWEQILSKQKTVTRRLGCADWLPGERRQAVKQMRGLKKGQKVERGPVLECISNRPEPLNRINSNLEYGFSETGKEGFQPAPTTIANPRDAHPYSWPSGFVDMFCILNRCKPEQIINRIEFKYIE